MIPEELEAYAALARTIEVEGDLVECGVYCGESLSAVASALPGRRVWAYDSFQGFPPGTPGVDDDVALGLVGAVQGIPALVRERVEPHAAELVLREGWFADTFEEPLPERIAWLSVDCDLYASVLLTLRVMAPRVVPGGIITLDDWSTFIGCRRAFEEWAADAPPEIKTFGPIDAGWWRV